MQCFVRGILYYISVSLLHAMKAGDLLQLVSEYNNPHHAYAIGFHWNCEKINYIPAESNEILSKLLHAGIPELYENDFYNRSNFCRIMPM